MFVCICINMNTREQSLYALYNTQLRAVFTHTHIWQQKKKKTLNV